MKSLKYLLLAVSLLAGSGLIAETKAQAAKRKAAAARLKEHEKKYHHQTKKAKTEKVAYTRKPVKAKTTKTAAHTSTAASTKSSGGSYMNQLTNALGWTGGAAAATATTSAIAHGEIHHRGPEDWHKKHHFPAGWTYGFTGRWVNGVWLFAGHDLRWWYENEPVYYRDVVRPEARKAGITEPQHFAHELAKHK